MTEQNESVDLDQQIAELEMRLRAEMSQKGVGQLATLKIRKQIEKGETEVEAKKRAYKEIAAFLESDQRLHGRSPFTSFLRFLFEGACRALEYNLPDPLDQEVRGIKLYSLDLQGVESLELESAEEYLQLSSALDKWKRLFGDFPDLSRMIISLRLKADEVGKR